MAAIEGRIPWEQWRGRTSLRACQVEIVAARAQLSDARRCGARVDVESFRAGLVAALEEYVVMIERSGAPVPPGLCAELRMYRSLGHRS